MRKASLETWGDVEGYRQRLIQSSEGVCCNVGFTARWGQSVIFFRVQPLASPPIMRRRVRRPPFKALTGVRLFFAARLPGQVPSFQSGPDAIGYFSSRVHSAAPLALAFQQSADSHYITAPPVQDESGTDDAHQRHNPNYRSTSRQRPVANECSAPPATSCTLGTLRDGPCHLWPRLQILPFDILCP